MKVFSIIAFVVSGYFLFCLNLLSFVSIEDANDKVTGPFIVVLLLFLVTHAVGCFCFKKPTWKYPSSITFMIVGLMMLIVLFVIFSSPYNPSMKAAVDADLTELCNNFALGVPTFLVTMSMGIVLFVSAKKTKQIN